MFYLCATAAACEPKHPSSMHKDVQRHDDHATHGLLREANLT